MQIGLHDGKSLISDQTVNVGDSVVLEVPQQKILDIIKLEKGCQAMVIKGINAGEIGTVDAIEEGTFRLPKRILLNLGERKIEIPTDLVMAVGKEKPTITIR